LKQLHEYLWVIEKQLIAGNATEHTHRPALKMLVEGLVKGVIATNEPSEAFQIGYIETKDIGKSLDEAEKLEQLKRYRDSLPNLILTDYLEFRWYVNGERCFSARLGTPTKDDKIKRDKAGAQAVGELLNDFLAHEAEAVGTPTELAKRLGRPLNAVNEIIKGKKSITADTALQLEAVMPEIPARFWLNLETDYQLTKALIGKRTKVK